jgi:hypothetical protein
VGRKQTKKDFADQKMIIIDYCVDEGFYYLKVYISSLICLFVNWFETVRFEHLLSFFYCLILDVIFETLA